MKAKKIILTIGRQFGSGGREIGRRLAEELQIAFYDRELLLLAANESGLSPEVFEKADEQEPKGLSFAFFAGLSPLGIYPPNNDILSNERLFKLQSDVIRMLAEKESCIIIGRCSDYVLRDNPSMLSIFIHDKIENRIDRVVKMLNISASEAKELISKSDKARAAYYNYFTDKQWGTAAAYNFTVDVSVLGITGTVLFLKELIEKFYG